VPPEGVPEDWASRLPKTIDPGNPDSSWHPPVQAEPNIDPGMARKGEDVEQYRLNEDVIRNDPKGLRVPLGEGEWDADFPKLFSPFSFGHGLRGRSR